MKRKKVAAKQQIKKTRKDNAALDWIVKCAVDSSAINRILDIAKQLSNQHESQFDFLRKVLDHHGQQIDRMSRILEGRIASEAQKKLDSLAEQKRFSISGREFVLVENKRRK